jgi:D-aminoacyl-tRNA deacylase
LRVVLQRVQYASVSVDHKVVGSIDNGILVLLGIEHTDTNDDIEWLVNKIVNLRIFSDAEDKMNLSIKDVNGRILVISQFTLFANSKKGNRPSYIDAARPEIAVPLYESFIDALDKIYIHKTEKGIFGADMKVSLLNDGPVTITMDTKNKE